MYVALAGLNLQRSAYLFGIKGATMPSLAILTSKGQGTESGGALQGVIYRAATQQLYCPLKESSTKRLQTDSMVQLRPSKDQRTRKLWFSIVQSLPSAIHPRHQVYITFSQTKPWLKQKPEREESYL